MTIESYWQKLPSVAPSVKREPPASVWREPGATDASPCWLPRFLEWAGLRLSPSWFRSASGGSALPLKTGSLFTLGPTAQENEEMTRVVQRRERARRDFVGIARYYAEEAELELARQFLKQAEETFGRLASSPGIGRRYQAEHAGFPPIRFFPIARLKKYLVFYLHTSDSIQIVRVLHSARELSSILAEEIGVEGEEETAPEE